MPCAVADSNNPPTLGNDKSPCLFPAEKQKEAEVREVTSACIIASLVEAHLGLFARHALSQCAKFPKLAAAVAVQPATPALVCRYHQLKEDVFQLVYPHQAWNLETLQRASLQK